MMLPRNEFCKPRFNLLATPRVLALLSKLLNPTSEFVSPSSFGSMKDHAAAAKRQQALVAS